MHGYYVDSYTAFPYTPSTCLRTESHFYEERIGRKAAGAQALENRPSGRFSFQGGTRLFDIRIGKVKELPHTGSGFRVRGCKCDCDIQVSVRET